MQTGLDDFMNSFHRFVFHNGDELSLAKDDIIKGFEQRGGEISLYTFAEREELQQHLLSTFGIHARELHEVDMTLEDGFIGLMGKY